ncbi:MAG: hypothetical protein V1900_00970 [Candidatus Aenigmatarchaeota archaeon]
MSKDSYIEKLFPVDCFGRNENGAHALKKPEEVKVRIYQDRGDQTSIMSLVDCRYNPSGSEYVCNAGNGICPYRFDIPQFDVPKQIAKKKG